MKKGKLIKEGKYWKITSVDFKNPMPINGDFGLSDDMNGKEVSFDTTGGPVRLIIFDGKKYSKQQSNITQISGQTVKNQDHGVNSNSTVGKAHAPYNFVPLNDIIVTIEGSSNENLSGYINLDLTTLTPLFIRGIGSNFFGVDSPVIPGSSIRGMLRTLVEIISYSEMVFADKRKRFFYRNISDTFYRDKFINRDNRSHPPLVKTTVKSGWLRKIGREYFLTPSDTDSSGRQYYRINGSFIGSTFQPSGSKLSLPIFSFKKLYIDLLSITKLKRKNGFDLEYNIIGSFSDVHGVTKCDHEAYLVASGPFARKKHFQWVINEASKAVSLINVSTHMEVYQMDDNIDEDASLLKMLERSRGNPVPCFYLEDGKGAIEAIGHTGIFRLAYLYNVSNFSTQRRYSSHLDFPTSIFGSTEKQSKIFVEDAVSLNSENAAIYNDEVRLKILQSPRPTSFQLYIEQPDTGIRTKDALHNWGTKNGRIRGNKLYWHRPTTDKIGSEQSWVFDTNNASDFQKKKKLLSDPVKPVKSDQSFISRIRFNDLSKEELGVILTAIELPVNCHHKLGMGKPLGLGSIRLKAELKLINQPTRYKNLFCEAEKYWESGFSNSISKDECKNAFIAILNKQLNMKYLDANDYWNRDQRLKELKALLTFISQPETSVHWINETEYLRIDKPVIVNGEQKTLNEYSDRKILPRPSQIIAPFLKRPD